MPLIYRVMKLADDGKPVVEQSGKALGVRVPADICPDAHGNVSPGTGGMSVSPSLAQLPIVFVPKRLQHLVPRARGSNSPFVWRMGDGPFVVAVVAPGLVLQPDKPNHGTVQPDSVMLLSGYQDALAATRNEWVIDESGV